MGCTNRDCENGQIMVNRYFSAGDVGEDYAPCHDCQPPYEGDSMEPDDDYYLERAIWPWIDDPSYDTDDELFAQERSRYDCDEDEDYD